MSRRRNSLIAIAILVVITMVGVAIAPLQTPISSGVSDANDEFAAFMTPRLTALLASAIEVEGMVEGRSRNVLALRAESERIESISSQIDAWLAQRELGNAEQRIADDYEAGIVRIRRAISAAYDAIGSFDFSSMPEMIPIFTEGRAYLESALAPLLTESEPASSYTVDIARH